MEPQSPTEQLLRELTDRYGSTEALFFTLDALRADLWETTEEIPGLPLRWVEESSGRHALREAPELFDR
ncbi:hypothetical protein ABIA39_007858 [Nocardia sp. GAS34]|uniref:hypothetical protein n=1 Tax=unclassified Nocardia TaxID=2637762 RepID=UPI003D1B12EE